MTNAWTVRILTSLAATLIATFAGCNTNDPHLSAESLLRELVAAQANADSQHLTRLMYKPETLETLGQSKEDMFNLVLQPGKTVSESQLIDLKPTDSQRFEKQHDGVSIRLLPTPIGKLEMRFKEQSGTNRIAVMYGKESGKYYISTYQQTE